MEFTESGEAMFLTSELGLSLLQLMPRSPAENAGMKKEHQVRDQSAETLTYIEARKAQKTPRLPPTSWEETPTLLTTYTLFLEIMFGDKNAYLNGLDCGQESRTN